MGVITQLYEEHRRKELVAIYRFIATADLEELASIIEEIRCCHDNLLAFNEDTGLLEKIASVAINGDGIQLNIARNVTNE